ncbi:MAG: glutamine--fructose-6-phosphate transaminase (isomerizing) [Candidatus Ratteibacteria bacterium]|nr:glutamine--fructose-6-phosphate transaminase (isomerizing) [Candidatus Ratteibacteria bacterium]
MCGIIGYIGNNNAVPIILEGLRKLEYRGYDSAGIAVLNKGKISLSKRKGKIADLENSIKKKKFLGNPGLGHTRWATHGDPSDINAHPHADCSGKIAVVHNGIIENYASLRQLLEEEGHLFKSSTDTEVFPHLIEKFYKGDLLKAVQEALALIEGAYAFAVICEDEPDKIIAARLGSPLVVGIGKNGNFFVASDTVAIVKYTRRVIYLDDGEIAVITPKGYHITDIHNGKKKKEVENITWSLEKITKDGFSHYMFKEICQQDQTVYDAMRGRILKKQSKIKLGGLESPLKWFDKKPKPPTGLDCLLNAKKIIIVACGTSWHAGLIGKYMFENILGIPAQVEYASEARYKNFIVDENSVVIGISQSGETADTISALREAKKKKAVTLGLVNCVGSTIARETHAGIYLHAGPEIGVASTKAFTSQVCILALITLLMGQEKHLINKEKSKRIINSILKIPIQIGKILKESNSILKIARKYAHLNNFLYLGRGYNFPVALEGALKLKEISYIHAEGYPAAEMKHGPIALIDKNMPVVFIATDTENQIYKKIVSNIEEVKSRHGQVIAISSEGNNSIKKIVDSAITVPKTLDFLTPLLTVIPLQLFAYHIAVLRGCDVDKPRNLAKSVTVE